ncbi:MAG: hypothetical protein ACYC3X_25970 [Pirellulaceae bacterium]
MSVASLLPRSTRPGFGPRRIAASLWAGWSVLTVAAGVTLADSADVRFDTMNPVSCRDVTTPADTADDPQQRLVAARFQVTALPADDERNANMQYVYHFLSPTGNVQIVDYEPRTTQVTSLAGNVVVEQTKEANQSLDVSLSGGFQPFAQGTAGADADQKTSSHIRYEVKPPLEVVLVAGTVQRGTGVYFKLLPATELAWEGSREFVITMRVPRHWRADLMYLRCEAQQHEHDRMVPRGSSRFVMGLYSAGDDEARAAVEALNLAEVTLRRTAAQRQQDIARRALPSVVHKLGALLDVYDPRIPEAWLDRLIYGPANIEQYDFVDYLPADVQRMAGRYTQAKLRLSSEFSGKRLARNEASQLLGVR